MIKKLDHIAIAVNNLEDAEKFYRTVLGLKPAGTELVVSQKTKVGFYTIGDNRIELVQPSEPDSPISRFLESKGQGIHHICFEVDNVEAAMERLLEKGATLIDRQARPGAHNTKIVFIHPKSSGGVLIELSERLADNS